MIGLTCLLTCQDVHSTCYFSLFGKVDDVRGILRSHFKSFTFQYCRRLGTLPTRHRTIVRDEYTMKITSNDNHRSPLDVILMTGWKRSSMSCRKL